MPHPEKAAAALECTACGACCFGSGERYLRLSGSDHARMAPADDALVHFIGNRCYVRQVDGHCKALAIRSTGTRFRCTVYSTRPEPCRALERGSPACLAERERKQQRATDAEDALNP